MKQPTMQQLIDAVTSAINAEEEKITDDKRFCNGMVHALMVAQAAIQRAFEDAQTWKVRMVTIEGDEDMKAQGFKANDFYLRNDRDDLVLPMRDLENATRCAKLLNENDVSS